MKTNRIKEGKDIYIEKCQNYEECLIKLNELFCISGINIEYDDENQKAYLVTESRKIPMEKMGPETFYIRINDKLIGFNFRFYGGTLGFGVEMEVVLIDGNNLQSYTFKQNYFENDLPWFYYDECINGQSRGFSSNGHIGYFSYSNVPNRSSLNTLKVWGNNTKIGRFTKVNAQILAFGGMHRSAGYDDEGRKLFSYIPTIDSEVIKNGKAEVRSLISSTTGPSAVYEVKRKYHYTSDADDGIFIPYHRTNEKPLNAFDKLKVFQPDDLEMLDYCIDILQRKENIMFYQDMTEYLMEQPVYKYISKYFTNIFNGIEYYQKLNRVDLETKTAEIDKALKL